MSRNALVRRSLGSRSGRIGATLTLQCVEPEPFWTHGPNIQFLNFSPFCHLLKFVWIILCHSVYFIFIRILSFLSTPVLGFQTKIYHVSSLSPIHAAWRVTTVIADIETLSRVSSCEMCGSQSGTGTGFFSASTSAVPCQYHSTVAPYLTADSMFA